MEAHNVGMVQLTENADLALDLGHARRVAPQRVLLDELDSDLNIGKDVVSWRYMKKNVGAMAETNLDTSFLLPPELHFTELALADCVAQDVFAKLDLFLAS